MAFNRKISYLQLEVQMVLEAFCCKIDHPRHDLRAACPADHTMNCLAYIAGDMPCIFHGSCLDLCVR